MVKWFRCPHVRMGNKCDESDFGLSILSQKLLASTDFQSLQRMVRKTKKHPVSSSSADRNVSLMREERGEGADWSKLTGR